MPILPGTVLEDASGYLLFVISANESEVVCIDDPVQTHFPCVRVTRNFVPGPDLEAAFFSRDPRIDEAERFRRAFGDLPSTPLPSQPEPEVEAEPTEPGEGPSRFEREDPCPE